MIRALRDTKFVFGRKYFAPTEKLSRLSGEVRELGRRTVHTEPSVRSYTFSSDSEAEGRCDPRS